MKISQLDINIVCESPRILEIKITVLNNQRQQQMHI